MIAGGKLIFSIIIGFLLVQICRPLTTDADEFNPYRVLGVKKTTSQGDIKKAYKKLVMLWHPDRNKNPQAKERILEVNRAYGILSNPDKRRAYDRYGVVDEHMDYLHHHEQFFQEQHYKFQYVRWPPPPKRQQSDLKNFILPFASVAGTLFFIFLIGLLLKHLNPTENSTNKQRSRKYRDEDLNASAKNNKQSSEEWHPEDPKTPLTDEEKQQRIQTRIWRTMSPLIRELRAETQFGLIRLLKPGCRSIIVLVDKESKEIMLQKFARHIYCLRNNKTFSFGFLIVPKNLTWFGSLLELTLPGDEQQEKDDSGSVSTVTTDTNTSENGQKEEKTPFTVKFKAVPKTTANDKLKNINSKHTLGTVLVICGWKLYFSIYHPMHRPPSIKSRTVQLETLGDEEEEFGEGENYENGTNKIMNFVKKAPNEMNTDNVLNGFPTFLERLLEGTVRRYYIPEWPDNLI